MCILYKRIVYWNWHACSFARVPCLCMVFSLHSALCDPLRELWCRNMHGFGICCSYIGLHGFARVPCLNCCWCSRSTVCMRAWGSCRNLCGNFRGWLWHGVAWASSTRVRSLEPCRDLFNRCHAISSTEYPSSISFSSCERLRTSSILSLHRDPSPRSCSTVRTAVGTCPPTLYHANNISIGEFNCACGLWFVQFV